jgi:hypothetical protein
VNRENDVESCCGPGELGSPCVRVDIRVSGHHGPRGVGLRRGKQATRGSLASRSRHGRARWPRPTTIGQRGDCQATRLRLMIGRCFRLASNVTASSRQTPGVPLMSVCGLAQGDLRGHLARGSKRGARLAKTRAVLSEAVSQQAPGLPPPSFAPGRAPSAETESPT